MGASYRTGDVVSGLLELQLGNQLRLGYADAICCYEQAVKRDTANTKAITRLAESYASVSRHFTPAAACCSLHPICPVEWAARIFTTACARTAAGRHR